MRPLWRRTMPLATYSTLSLRPTSSIVACSSANAKTEPRDDEQAPQLGQTRNDVMGQAVRDTAAAVRAFKERHYGEGAARIRTSGRFRNAGRRLGSANRVCPFQGPLPFSFDQPPSLADRREVTVFRLELALGRSQVFFAGGELALPFERRQE